MKLKKGLLYKFVTLTDDQPKNTCEYVTGLWKSMFVTMFLTLFTYSLVYFPFAVIKYQSIVMPDQIARSFYEVPFLLGSIVWVSCILACSIYGFVWLLEEQKTLRKLFQAIKDKTCFKIDWEE